MSNVNDNLLSYTKCNGSVSTYDILRENDLLYIFGDKLCLQDIDRKKSNFNKLIFRLKQRILLEICSIFEKNEIPFIVFKGIVLSYLLYNDVTNRVIGDIDIYTDTKNFVKALEILWQLGFQTQYENGLENQHHVVLANEKCIVELHKSIFHPNMGLDESYLCEHLSKVNNFNQEITTFDTTATLLHLIYHLYMDVCMTSQFYFLFVLQQPIKVNRFLYRVYEIGLYAEKYFDEIKWNDIEEDIKKQKLRIHFGIMVENILKILPKALPENIIHIIRNIDYINDAEDSFYCEFLDAYTRQDDYKTLLCKYIDTNWMGKNNNAIVDMDRYSFTLLDKGDKDILKCFCHIEKIKEGIKIDFEITDKDLYFSKTDNYVTEESDGVHILLCSTKEYSYNSIFFFPKDINGNIGVISYDTLKNEVIETKRIFATYDATNQGYNITAILSREFVEKNHLDSIFYLGLVISDCGSEIKKRKRELLTASEQCNWYNPLYFIKIIL